MAAWLTDVGHWFTRWLNDLEGGSIGEWVSGIGALIAVLVTVWTSKRATDQLETHHRQEQKRYRDDLKRYQEEDDRRRKAQAGRVLVDGSPLISLSKDPAVLAVKNYGFRIQNMSDLPIVDVEVLAPARRDDGEHEWLRSHPARLDRLDAVTSAYQPVVEFRHGHFVEDEPGWVVFTDASDVRWARNTRGTLIKEEDLQPVLDQWRHRSSSEEPAEDGSVGGRSR
jgi:hypothetical protein